MLEKLSIKRLTASDLTFFEWHFRNHNAGNQKAINLNADVFVTELYPSLPDSESGKKGRIPLDLYLYGPGLNGEYNLQRKIVKGETYKNWRLNGEYVLNPDDSPERFNSLKPGDFAIFSFDGDIYPHSASVVFVAESIPEDKPLHAAIDAYLGQRRMMALAASELAKLAEHAKPDQNHPVHALLLDPIIEDASLGGIQGIKKLASRRAVRTITREELQRARQKAEENGQIGEEYVNDYLAQQQTAGRIKMFEWVASKIPLSPYDFEITENDGSKILIDVKSTSSGFNNSIHISYNELRQMRDAQERYDLYRVFSMAEGTARLRITEDVREFAKGVLEILDRLPENVAVDGISVSPSAFVFKDEVEIQLSDRLDDD